VPEQEFVFSLELSDEAFFEGMVNAVARAVLDAVGLAGDAGEVTGAVEQVTAAAGRHGRCQVRFQTHDGKLRIAVSSGGHPSWHTAIALPPS
jgi:hypothetical protein